MINLGDDLSKKWKQDKDSDGIPDAIKRADSVPNESFEYYNKLFQKDTTFFERLGNFIKAENKAGRYAKAIKDFALIFVPYGRTISSASEMATEIITDNTMASKEKSTTKSKTVITFGLLFLVGLLQLLGVDIGFELSPDAQWVTVGTGIVGVILRLVTDRPVKLGKLLNVVEDS